MIGTPKSQAPQDVWGFKHAQTNLEDFGCLGQWPFFWVIFHDFSQRAWHLQKCPHLDQKASGVSSGVFCETALNGHCWSLTACICVNLSLECNWGISSIETFFKDLFFWCKRCDSINNTTKSKKTSGNSLGRHQTKNPRCSSVPWPSLIPFHPSGWSRVRGLHIATVDP